MFSRLGWISNFEFSISVFLVLVMFATMYCDGSGKQWVRNCRGK